jgi:hypothetical protein
MVLTSILVALSTCLATALPIAAAPDFAGGLPAKIGEWKRPAAPNVYDRNSLFDYIDGGAELYLAFDFVKATTFEYSAGKEDLIKVDIFEMQKAWGAFGAFAHGRESIATEVGQGSEYTSGLLTFWKDRWYVSVLGYPETESKRKAVYEIAGAIAALIPGIGETPALLRALPKQGLVAASARTFHHHALQNDYAFVSHENVLGIGPGQAEAVLARYRKDDVRYVLLVVEAQATTTAAKAEHDLIAGPLAGRNPGKLRERWAGVRRSAQRIFIVLDAPSAKVVAQALTEAK